MSNYSVETTIRISASEPENTITNRCMEAVNLLRDKRFDNLVKQGCSRKEGDTYDDLVRTFALQIAHDQPFHLHEKGSPVYTLNAAYFGQFYQSLLARPSTTGFRNLAKVLTNALNSVVKENDRNAKLYGVPRTFN